MGTDQNLCDLSMNGNSYFTICVNSGLFEWQFSLFFLIFSEKLEWFKWYRIEYRYQTWIGFHNLELKWNASLWNAKDCLRVWIFHEFTATFTDRDVFTYFHKYLYGHSNITLCTTYSHTIMWEPKAQISLRKAHGSSIKVV